MIRQRDGFKDFCFFLIERHGVVYNECMCLYFFLKDGGHEWFDGPGTLDTCFKEGIFITVWMTFLPLTVMDSLIV